MLADIVYLIYMNEKNCSTHWKTNCYKRVNDQVVYAYHQGRNNAFRHAYHRPLFLVPKVSPFRTSGSQSRQYHVRDCGSSVNPTQSRWNYEVRGREDGKRLRR
jgi:hypothetical protein